MISEVDPSEIVPGLVLHLDPAVLEAEGAEYHPGGGPRARGDHYFLCVIAEASEGFWVPLSSKPGENRVRIPGHEETWASRLEIPLYVRSGRPMLEGFHSRRAGGGTRCT